MNAQVKNNEERALREQRTEQTLLLVKPDGLLRGLCGRIISRFEDLGLQLVGAKLVRPSFAHWASHYEEHQDKPFFEPLIQEAMRAPVLALVWEGPDAIALIRKHVGATEPREAAPGTIRGDYSPLSYAQVSVTGKAIRNVVHASSDPASAAREVALWFGADELCSYESLIDLLVR